VCWGKNVYGQLGNGLREERGVVARVTGLNDAVALAVGIDFSCALRRHGAVVCWGNNEDGQLGDGRGARPGALSLRPVAVAGLGKVQELVAGDYHACAREETGRVKCWGNAGNGQIGSDAQRAFAMPLSIGQLGTVRALASGGNHVCALENGGTVKCWGRNTEGQLGDGKSGSKINAVTVEGLSGATMIAAGHNHTCATRSDGSVLCWGDNAMHQLGPQARDPKHRTPVVVTGLRDVVQLVGGAGHTCARLSSGRVTCWGANGNGQLGHTSAAQSRSTPTAVRGVSDATDVTAGARHVCAIRARGDLVCWGSDDRVLGDLRVAAASVLPSVAWWALSMPDETAPFPLHGR
jgi:alpha-tubulin suppressor-like RCC1 family protein